MARPAPFRHGQNVPTAGVAETRAYTLVTGAQADAVAVAAPGTGRRIVVRRLFVAITDTTVADVAWLWLRRGAVPGGVRTLPAVAVSEGAPTAEWQGYMPLALNEALSWESGGFGAGDDWIRGLEYDVETVT